MMLLDTERLCHSRLHRPLLLYAFALIAAAVVRGFRVPLHFLLVSLFFATANVTFAMIVSSPPPLRRPFADEEEERKKAPCAVQITVDRCGDLPPLSPSRLLLPSPVVAVVDDGDPRRGGGIWR